MKAKILENRPLGKRYFTMTFEWPDDNALPGQFVMVRVSELSDPLLRRPMSIAGLRDGKMNIIYALAGRGTALLSEIREGETIDVIGPFGNSFDIPAGTKNVLCVMGGVGTAPFIFLKNRTPEMDFAAFYGAADKDGLGITVPIADIHYSTVDGSAGEKGLVTDILLKSPKLRDKGSVVLACGPKGMLKAVDAICVKNGIPGRLSLEERMGCGFGVCLGCVVETKTGAKRVCAEGPVFPTGSVKWPI